ncbi:hypothetical protein [Brachybacterium paraconglomeratum]|uniref:hypothetical protein n=1 Tax=Brachybacterium paraconglomeratum TaxID=173362 RepID=UPI00248F5800|nr:hypothetical protein [Brachybacterium paraconglomeratum]
MEARIINPDTPIFRLAQNLQCTPARASNLVFNYRLRSNSGSEDSICKNLAAATEIADILPDTNKIILNIEDRYWRETLIADLKSLKVFSDTSFNRERIAMPLNAFLDSMEILFGAAGVELKERVEAKELGGTQPQDPEKARGRKLEKLIDEFKLKAVGAAGSYTATQILTGASKAVTSVLNLTS